MQKYLITGGAGFIGCHLVEKLIECGKDVVVYDNLFSGRLENIQEFMNKVKFVNGDLNDYARLEQTIKGFLPDVVIHLAALAFIPYCNEHKRETFHVNVKGTYTLLDLCYTYQPKKMLFASSAGVYPVYDMPYSETHEIRPFDVYGATKICAENLMELFAKQTPCQTVSCRIFCAYGPKSTNEYVIPKMINQLKKGINVIRLGNINTRRDFVYVNDVVEALFEISSADTGMYEAFNIGTGFEYSVKELVGKISSIISKDLTIRSVSELKRKVDRHHLWADISKIKDKIGWSPRYNIDRGLEALIDFELNNKK